MTRHEATRAAAKRFGAKAHLRIRDGRTSPELREASISTLRVRRERVKAIDAEIAARLAALDWYRDLQAERRELTAAITMSLGNVAAYKFAVGKIEGIGFHVYGQGDTWEEAFAAADKRIASEGGAR
jgi:hypothetical protein